MLVIDHLWCEVNEEHKGEKFWTQHEAYRHTSAKKVKIKDRKPIYN